MELNRLLNFRINDKLIERARIRAAEKSGEIKKILTLSGYIRELILEDLQLNDKPKNQSNDLQQKENWIINKGEPLWHNIFN